GWEMARVFLGFARGTFTCFMGGVLVGLERPTWRRRRRSGRRLSAADPWSKDSDSQDSTNEGGAEQSHRQDGATTEVPRRSPLYLQERNSSSGARGSCGHSCRGPRSGRGGARSLWGWAARRRRGKARPKKQRRRGRANVWEQ